MLNNILSILLLLPLLATHTYAAPLPPVWQDSWIKTDFSRRTIDLSDVVDSGIPKDGIPAINRPRFVSIKKAKQWVHTREPVIAVVIKGQARAYPLQILIYHQVVNDKIRGVPVLVTFCPLCNSGYAHSRVIDSKTLRFGSTGRLRNSGLIMYDHATQSWWQQFTGDSIVGHYAGKQLTVYPSYLISFADFVENYPQGKVLSRDTGFRRQYGLNPFRGYDSVDNSPFKFQDATDSRLPPMERVLNIRIGDATKLYPYSIIKNSVVLNDFFQNKAITIFCKSDYASPLDKLKIINSSQVPAAAAYSRTINGKTLTFDYREGKIMDNETRSSWNIFGKAIEGPMKDIQLQRVDIGVQFAFAALAFKPESTIYQSKSLPENQQK